MLLLRLVDALLTYVTPSEQALAAPQAIGDALALPPPADEPASVQSRPAALRRSRRCVDDVAGEACLAWGDSARAHAASQRMVVLSSGEAATGGTPHRAMLLSRYRAHPMALQRMSGAVVAAVMDSLSSDSDPSCGVSLDALLDSKGRLMPGTVALVQGDSQGRMHAHLYRGEALGSWLAGGAGRSHPATRASVDVDTDVFQLA